jgi:hypothetical protein
MINSNNDTNIWRTGLLLILGAYGVEVKVILLVPRLGRPSPLGTERQACRAHEERPTCHAGPFSILLQKLGTRSSGAEVRKGKKGLSQG